MTFKLTHSSHGGWSTRKRVCKISTSFAVVKWISNCPAFGQWCVHPSYGRTVHLHKSNCPVLNVFLTVQLLNSDPSNGLFPNVQPLEKNKFNCLMVVLWTFVKKYLSICPTIKNLCVQLSESALSNPPMAGQCCSTNLMLDSCAYNYHITTQCI